MLSIALFSRGTCWSFGSRQMLCELKRKIQKPLQDPWAFIDSVDLADLTDWDDLEISPYLHTDSQPTDAFLKAQRNVFQFALHDLLKSQSSDRG